MRKDVKLGLAVGSILFSAVMVYVLFFASHGKTGTDQARSGSGPAVDAAKQSGIDSQTPGHNASPATEHPLASLLSHDSATVTPTTLPADTGANVSIFGPASRPAMPGDSTSASDSTVASSPVRSGTFNWRDALENGGNAIARSVTPGSSERSTSFSSTAAAPTLDATQMTRPSTEARTYVVKQGDTLWSIAKAEYGSPQYYSHLARANPKAANRLRAGMKLILPAKDEVVPETAKAVLATPKVVDATRQYRVQPGDNLYIICKKLYGKTDRVTKLYELNKDLIGPNPSALKLNMVLQLPEPPTSNTAITGGSSSADNTTASVLAGTMR